MLGQLKTGAGVQVPYPPHYKINVMLILKILGWVAIIINLAVLGVTLVKGTTKWRICLDVSNIITIAILMVKNIILGETSVVVLFAILLGLDVLCLIYHLSCLQLENKMEREIEAQISFNKSKTSLKHSMYLMEKYKD